MSLIQGTLSLRRFLVLGPVPSEQELHEGLKEHCFRPFEDGLEEERMGWCDWRNLLILPPDRDWVVQERFAVFGLRIDSRKVPGALLKAQVDLRLQTLQKEKDLAFVGREARTSLAEEVKVDLLLKVLPTPKVAEVAWDLKGGMLWTTASSSKTQSALFELFMKSFGLELQPLAPLLLAGRMLPHVSVDSLMALDPLDLTLENA